MLHSIANEWLTVTVDEKGAQLQSILGKDGTEYLWQGDSRYWSDRAINIFPYVARMTQGSYYLDGKLYHMDIHGFAPYYPFALTEKTETRLVFSMEADAETRKAYPRDFAFSVCYVLDGSTLAVTFQVENRDEKTMYFGMGGHPGFNVPLTEGKTFEDYRLRFSEACEPIRVGFTADCYLNGEDVPFLLEEGTILPLRHDMFDDDAIVLTNMTRQITLESLSDSHGVTVTYPDMDYLGLWHCPKTDAPYVCIEPWSSLPSTSGKIAVLEEQKDLLSLEPGASCQNRWTIQVH